jgi:O-antigen/teichoic acid export membrane protein
MSLAAATRSQIVLLGSHGIQLSLSLVVTVVLGRHLTDDAFGFFALVGTVFALAAFALDGGMGSVAVREIGRNPHRERALLEGLVAWRRLVGVAVGVVVAVAALGEPDAGRALVILGAAVVIPLTASTGLAPAFQVRQAPDGPVILGILGVAFTVAAALALRVVNAPGPSFGWIIVAREALAATGFAFLAVRILGYRPRAGLTGRDLGPFLRAALVHGLAVLCFHAYFHLDVFLVRMLRGDAELGAYAAVFRPLNPLLRTPGLLMMPFLPILASLARRDRAAFRRRVTDAARTLCGLGAVGAVTGALLAPELLDLLYGGRYSDAGSGSIAAFRWLCLALALVFTATPFTTALLSDGGERALLVLGLVGLAVNAAGNLALIPWFGFQAAAATTALTEAGVGIAAALVFVRRTGGSLSLGGLPYLLPAALPGALLLLMGGSGSSRLVAGTLAALVATAILVASPAARRLRGRTEGDTP